MITLQTIELYTLKGVAREYLRAVLVLKRKVPAALDLLGSRAESWPDGSFGWDLLLMGQEGERMESPFLRWGHSLWGEMEGFCSGRFEFSLRREMCKRWLVAAVGVEESHGY